MPDLPNESGSFCITASRRIEHPDRGLLLDVEYLKTGDQKTSSISLNRPRFEMTLKKGKAGPPAQPKLLISC